MVVMDLRHPELRVHTTPNLLQALRKLGIDLKPIHCGGDDFIMQQREQWTDGANAFCLAPGVIVMYSRNRVTAAELDRVGYQVLTASELIADPSLDLLDGRKHAIMLESAELTRARGGPRCMTMPLARIPS